MFCLWRNRNHKVMVWHHSHTDKYPLEENQNSFRFQMCGEIRFGKKEGKKWNSSEKKSQRIVANTHTYNMTATTKKIEPTTMEIEKLWTFFQQFYFISRCFLSVRIFDGFLSLLSALLTSSSSLRFHNDVCACCERKRKFSAPQR